MANVTAIVKPTADISKTEYAISLMFATVCMIITSILSITGTTISIKTFCLMGLDDGMTFTFFVLSITELAYSVFCLAMSVASVFHCVELTAPKTLFIIDPFSLLIYFANICVMVHMSIQVITTFLAVARCLCVVKPIHFKNAFTKRRCVALLIFVWAFSLVSYAPLFASMSIVPQFDPRINVSRPSLWLSPNRRLVKDIIWTIEDATIPFCTEIIVIVCVIIMADGLRRAAKFRMAASNASNAPGFHASQKVGGKELLIIRQVALISAFYILTNTPKVASNLYGVVVPQYTLGGQYNNIYLVVFAFRKLIETLNCCVSFPVYFQCNPKFRSLTFRWSNKS
ncbi:hypothetical protein BgiMline_016630 [Biomphalaria glabrata]|nr:fMet-Leu-Phe receptor-like [Biomphalaria glabrata]